MESICLIAASRSEVATLADMVEISAGEICAIVVGDGASAQAAAKRAAEVKWIESSSHSEQFAQATADLARQTGCDVVIAAATPFGRSVVGLIAEQEGASVLSNVTAVKIDSAICKVERSVYDDFAETDVVSKGKVCLLVNPLSVKDGGATSDGGGDAAACSPIEKVEVCADAFAEVVETVEIASSKTESAAYVVSIDSGVKTKEEVDEVKQLAGLLGAEVGASMNIIENTNFLPGERYIGLSGLRIAPKLYLALGISGASQHRAGLRNAGCVAVVNNDPKASFFNHADYGIVGDVEEVVPELISVLSQGAWRHGREGLRRHRRGLGLRGGDSGLRDREAGQERAGRRSRGGACGL